jgi:predicted DCC family thiol-disulfide oxidoreductase YuxK
MPVHSVLYDPDCPLCTFQMRLLSWLDWNNQLALIPLSDPRTALLAPSLTREDLLEALHCVTPEGRILRGARALRFIGARLPLLWPLALVLWFPGVILVAEIVYRWISRNRYWISRLFGCKDACTLLPKKERSQDS